MKRIHNLCKAKKWNRISGIFIPTVIAISTFMLLGCATPRVAVNPEVKAESYKDYKIVYLLSPDKDGDPRNIFPQIMDRLKAMGFQVYKLDPENPIGSQGTGFIIDPKGYVLTCAHMFEKENKASLWIKGKRHVANVVNKDKDKDLALLKIIGGSSDFKSLPIARENIYKMGQEIYTIGFPLSDVLGNFPRLNKGLISSTVGVKDNPDHLQFSAQIQPGNSGGPLLNENGLVVGVIQSTLNPMNIMVRTGGNLPQNVNFAVKTNIVRDFLKESSEDINVDQNSIKKLEFEQVSDSIVQIRAGEITEEFLKQPKLICNFVYQSYWDIWYRFRIFHVEFYDVETGKLLLKAGQYGPNMLTTEAKVMDQTFEQIRTHFRPENITGK